MNVYENEEDRKEYLAKYFTEEGVKALENRLNGLAKEYIGDKKYPIVVNMLGFVELMIPSRAHHEGMLENLRQILAMRYIEVDEK